MDNQKIVVSHCSTDLSFQHVRSYSNDANGNHDAENEFVSIVKSQEPNIADDALAAYLESGYYEYSGGFVIINNPSSRRLIKTVDEVGLQAFSVIEVSNKRSKNEPYEPKIWKIKFKEIELDKHGNYQLRYVCNEEEFCRYIHDRNFVCIRTRKPRKREVFSIAREIVGRRLKKNEKELLLGLMNGYE